MTPAADHQYDEAVEAEIAELLKAFSLDPPRDHVKSLADEVRWLRRKRNRSGCSGLDSRQRMQAAAHARALQRHMHDSPRNPATTERRRGALLMLLDTLPTVIQIATVPGCMNATPVLARLKDRTYTAEDMANLVAAIEAIPSGPGVGRSNAPFRRLLVAAVHAWEVCGRTERYTAERYTADLTVTGPLPDLIRRLIELAGLGQPSHAALERHLREVKNV